MKKRFSLQCFFGTATLVSSLNPTATVATEALKHLSTYAENREYNDEKQNASNIEFTLLNLKSEFLEGSEIFSLSEKILNENTDIVCIQEVTNDDHAHILYEVLKETYSYFIFVPPVSTMSLTENYSKSGMLIASKYPIEQPIFNTFSEEKDGENEIFIDFIVKKNDACPLHIYVEEESSPYFLCGDLNSLQNPPEFKIITSGCINDQVHSPTNKRKNLTLNSHQTSTTHRASTFIRDGFRILTIRSDRNRDDDRKAGGSWEVGGGISYGGNDGPRFDGYAKVEAHDDKGNFVEGRADHNFNSGEGTVGFRGGNSDEKDK